MKTELKQIKIAIATFAWNADFNEFCRVCGFHPDTSENSYAMQKWREFQALQQGLNAFDDETLSRMVEAGISR
jgi:hypothetical protein